MPVEGARLSISGDVLVGVERDALDVERLVPHRIEKSRE